MALTSQKLVELAPNSSLTRNFLQRRQPWIYFNTFGWGEINHTSNLRQHNIDSIFIQDIHFKKSVGVHYVHSYHINGNNSTQTQFDHVYEWWAHFGANMRKPKQRMELDKPPVSRQHIEFHFWCLVALFLDFSSIYIEVGVVIWYFYLKTLNLKWTSSTRTLLVFHSQSPSFQVDE